MRAKQNYNLKIVIMKKIFLTLSVASLVAFTSCKKNVEAKINQENVTKAAERDAQSSDFPTLSFDKTEFPQPNNL